MEPRDVDAPGVRPAEQHQRAHVVAIRIGVVEDPPAVGGKANVSVLDEHAVPRDAATLAAIVKQPEVTRILSVVRPDQDAIVVQPVVMGYEIRLQQAGEAGAVGVAGKKSRPPARFTHPPDVEEGEAAPE